MAHAIMKIFMGNGNFKNNLLFIVGITIITYILYIRLFLKRMPKELNIEMSLFTKTIFITMFIGFLMLLLNSIRLFLINKKFYKPKMPKNQYFVFIKDKLQLYSDFWSNSLKKVHERLVQGYLSYYLEKIGSYLPQYFKIYETYYLTLAFNFLPKSIVLVTFLIDVLFYQELYYFYKTAPLLLLPLIYQYLVYAVYQDALNGVFEADNCLVIINKKNNEIITGLYYFKIRCRFMIRYINEFDLSQYIYILKDSFIREAFIENTNINLHATLDHFMTKFNSLVDITCYMQFIMVWYETHLPLFNLILYTNYLFGSFIILYLIF